MGDFETFLINYTESYVSYEVSIYFINLSFQCYENTGRTKCEPLQYCWKYVWICCNPVHFVTAEILQGILQPTQKLKEAVRKYIATITKATIRNISNSTCAATFVIYLFIYLCHENNGVHIDLLLYVSVSMTVAVNKLHEPNIILMFFHCSFIFP